MPKSVVFDGLNLSLTRGTGIATYTRVLAGAVRSLGYRTGILYSHSSTLAQNSLSREVEFFDAPQPSSSVPKVDLRKIPEFFHTSLFGVAPQRVPITGTVLTAPLGASWVPCDDVYAAPKVFDYSRDFFAISGRFSKIQIPERPDLFHWTSPLPMRSNARANIYAVHDLVPLRMPYASLDRKRYYIKSMTEILRSADHVVTVSENSKHDIMKLFGVEEKRITNTYQAIDLPRRYLAQPEGDVADELAAVFGLGMRKYLLFYGSLEPKKNVGRLVHAYLNSKVDIPLVIVIAQTWLAENETQFLKQIIENEKNELVPRERRKIRRYEYLPFASLVNLIRGARAVVFPSIYEGFGLPVLESMMLGTPVITSNTSSIPEIAGDAALLVDPHDVDAIKNAIVKICRDGDLCAELRSRGRKQAERFSTDIYKTRIAELYSNFL